MGPYEGAALASLRMTPCPPTLWPLSAPLDAALTPSVHHNTPSSGSLPSPLGRGAPTRLRRPAFVHAEAW